MCYPLCRRKRGRVPGTVQPPRSRARLSARPSYQGGEPVLFGARLGSAWVSLGSAESSTAE